MRVRCAILIVALTLAACGSSAADSGGSRPTTTTTGTTTASTSATATSTTPARGARTPCGPPSAPTLAASRVARVYVVGGQVFGCSSQSPKTARRLGQKGTCIATTRVTAIAVAAALAAYGAQQCGVDTGTGSLVLRRLSDGRELRTFPATTAPARPESYSAVASVVVKGNGAVAWIGVASSIISHRRDVEVDAANGSGSVRVLDRSTRISPGSLRLRGSRLTWKDGGQTRSATLG